MENTLESALTISIVGFCVVFLCLTFFALLIATLNGTDNKIIAYRKRKAEEAQKNTEPTKPIISDGIDEDILPILFAAAYSVFGKQIIIRNIAFGNKTSNDSDWSRISRASSVATHNIRRRG